VRATTSASGETSAPSAPLTFTLDVSGAVSPKALDGSSTYDTKARIVVPASNLYGVPDGASVTLDVDLNNDGDYLDANESPFATATLSSGAAVFTGYSDCAAGRDGAVPGARARHRGQHDDLLVVHSARAGGRRTPGPPRRS